MLKVWGRRNSSNVQKVMWLIAELGLPYEHIPAGANFGRLDEPQFRALNPHGKIPVIQDGDLTVWESQAILRYLGAQYGRGEFWSDSAAERAVVDGWLDWSLATLQSDFNGFFWAYFRTPEAERDWAVIDSGRERSIADFRLLDGILAKRPFMIGNTLSLADIAIGCFLYRYFEFDIERPDLLNLAGYYQRLRERPAYREHVMVSFESLRGRLAF